MSRLVWWDYNGADVLRNAKTTLNVAMVRHYPDLGYSVTLWDSDIHDWAEIAMVADHDAAKMVALMNVEGTLV